MISIMTINTDEIEKMIIETKRAELIDWISILKMIILNKGTDLRKVYKYFLCNDS